MYIMPTFAPKSNCMTMRIDILTVLPEMLEGTINCSILKRAQDKGLAEIHLHNLRDYTTNKWRRVDDYPFGGEAGMVMQIEPIDRAISALKVSVITMKLYIHRRTVKPLTNPWPIRCRC